MKLQKRFGSFMRSKGEIKITDPTTEVNTTNQNQNVTIRLQRMEVKDIFEDIKF